jgi:hypothetical protein
MDRGSTDHIAPTAEVKVTSGASYVTQAQRDRSSTSPLLMLPPACHRMQWCKDIHEHQHAKRRCHGRGRMHPARMRRCCWPLAPTWSASCMMLLPYGRPPLMSTILLCNTHATKTLARVDDTSRTASKAHGYPSSGGTEGSINCNW